MSDSITPFIWMSIKQEAQLSAGNEPILASFYHTTLLRHDTLGAALSYFLAGKLASPVMPAVTIREIAGEAYARQPGLMDMAARDIQAVYARDPAVTGYAIPLLYLKGFHALQAFRISNWLWKANRRALALYFQSQISACFSVDIHPAAVIGQGVMLDHATGIVIGETAVVEDDVSILQAVTLGGTGKDSGDRHPKIRRGTVIGAGAKILGNIEVGPCSTVGAGAVVLHTVPPDTVVAGIPARPLGRALTDVPSQEMSQHFIDAVLTVTAGLCQSPAADDLISQASARETPVSIEHPISEKVTSREITQ